MKRLWIAVALMLGVFSLTFSNSLYLRYFTDDLTDFLLEAEVRCEEGNWEKALTLTLEAEDRWLSHATYLHTTLRHSDIDDVYLGFRQVKEFLRRQEDGEYSAANSVLIGHIGLMCEQEQFSLKNLF